jgi:hypothetical protein
MACGSVPCVRLVYYMDVLMTSHGGARCSIPNDSHAGHTKTNDHSGGQGPSGNKAIHSTACSIGEKWPGHEHGSQSLVPAHGRKDGMPTVF